MRSYYYPLSLIVLFACISCKKQQAQAPSTEIRYKLVNRTLKAADTRPLAIDINEDGRIDYSFFAQYVVLSNQVHLYTGVSPINDNSTKMGEPDDQHYLNMGDAAPVPIGTQVKDNLMPSKPWSSEFAYLAVRTEHSNGTKSYQGAWGDGNPQLLPLRISVNDSIYYGWARVLFNKATEELTLIDYAWNRTKGQTITAGQNSIK